MRNALKLALALGLFGLAGAIGWWVIRPALAPGGGKPEPPPAPQARGLPQRAQAELIAATDLEFPALLREMGERHSGPAVESELRRFLAARTQRVLNDVEEQVDALLESYRYRPAAELLERYKTAWKGLAASRAFTRRLEEVREEQEALVAGRKEESDGMFGVGKFEGARETLKTGWELEEKYRKQLNDYLAEVEQRIAKSKGAGATPVTPVPGPPASQQPVAATVLALPPALPGYPHPDVKRLAEARAALERARGLFGSRRFLPARKAFEELLGYYGDLAYVRRRLDSIKAMLLLVRHGTEGVKGLFRATSVKLRGKRLALRYEFKSAEEYSDWEEIETIPHQDSGTFEPSRAAVRGAGATSYLLRAFFNNDVKIACKARIEQPRTHGLLFCQDKLETRQLVLLATNHWFVEGENYVKERRGHSLLMIGKGTNNDVPVDSPDIGFIFKGGTMTKPAPPAGATITLTFAVKGDNMVGTVGYKRESCTLTYHTKGDDGRSIERVRPGLFVIQNSVRFSEIEIEGTLHPRYERARVDELLDLAEE